MPLREATRYGVNFTSRKLHPSLKFTCSLEAAVSSISFLEKHIFELVDKF